MWVGEVGELEDVETNYFLHVSSSFRYFVESNLVCQGLVSSLPKYFLYKAISDTFHASLPMNKEGTIL